MDREKLSQLEIWESYKYSELCTLLGESEKQGNSKKAQEREWARNFEYIKKGEKKGFAIYTMKKNARLLPVIPNM